MLKDEQIDAQKNSPFPLSADELTLDWFNAATADQVGAAAAALSVEPLDRTGDGFYGSHLKLTASYPGAEDAREFVAKLSPQDPEVRAVVNRINCFEREVNFYRHLARRSPVPVPACYFAGFDRERGESLLLLELVVGTTSVHVEGASYEQAVAAMRTAARLHRYWQGDPALDEPWLDKLTDARFTGAMVDAAVEAAPLALEKMPGLIPDWMLDQAPRAGEIIAAQDAVLNELPHTLVHYDYHVSNLMFPSGPEPADPVLIDWQFAVRGAGVWDVGAFCLLSLPVEQRRAWERELVLIYLSELEGAPVTAWPDWFEEAYVRVGLSFSAHWIRNAPVFDFDDGNVIAIIRELGSRTDAMIEDHDGRRLLP